MITDPNHLFYPKDALKGKDADVFYGREVLLQKCLDALGSRGTSCVIFGERGVGKTSLAWQVVTVLDGTNNKYSKKQLMRVGFQDAYKCVFHRIRPGVDSLGDLIISLLRPSSSPNSIQHLFPELYEDATIYTKFERKYQISLPILMSFESTFASQTKNADLVDNPILNSASREQNLAALFEDVLNEIEKLHPSVQIIFFVDEIDQANVKVGLGSLIKNSNAARFVFIGIANNITEIITDHESAGRKLIGGDIEVPTLSEQDIRFIFTGAQNKSKGGIIFSNEFLELAVTYSAGYPWIAQNIGFQALLSKLPSEAPIYIGASDFKLAVKNVVSVYERDEINRRLPFETVYDGSTTRQILDFLWTIPFAPTSDEIQETGVQPNVSRFVPTALNRLIELQILKINSNNRWQFIDPVVRILWKAYSDNLSTSSLTQ